MAAFHKVWGVPTSAPVYKRGRCTLSRRLDSKVLIPECRVIFFKVKTIRNKIILTSSNSLGI